LESLRKSNQVFDSIRNEPKITNTILQYTSKEEVIKTHNQLIEALKYMEAIMKEAYPDTSINKE